jgi:hypothetical protein
VAVGEKDVLGWSPEDGQTRNVGDAVGGSNRNRTARKFATAEKLRIGPARELPRAEGSFACLKERETSVAKEQ